MVLCRFFQNGYCRFGDACHYEHSRVGGQGGGGGGGRGGGGEHYGNQGRSEGYSSQSPNRYSNYENRADYRNDSRGGYKSDYRGDNKRPDYRNDNRNNSVIDNRGGYRGDNRSDVRSENRFAVLDDRHEGSRGHDSYQRGGGGGGRQYDARYSYRSDQQRKDGDSEDLTPAETLEVIAEDMEVWETGNMWLFSCYGYAREVKSFPGLDDLSADEVRLKAYEANASGTIAAHVNWLSQLAEDYRAKRAVMRKPDTSARSAVLNMIDNIKKSSSQNASSKTAYNGGAQLFTSETNIFGAATPATNVFGAATPATNVFGAATPATNVFGAATPATNVFGAATPATNVFGAATPATNVFGAAPPATNIFGAAAPTNAFSSSAYAGTASHGFSMTTSTPVMPTSGNAFGFGTSTPHNTFSPAAASEGFLQTASNPRLNRTTDDTPSAGQQNQSSSHLQLLGLYTPVAELTAEERAEFENAKFTLDHVPLRPPPKDMI